MALVGPVSDDLGLKLRLGVISRLGAPHTAQHYKIACECVWHDDAALPLFLAAWATNGVLAALAAAAQDGEDLGVLAIRRDGMIRFRLAFALSRVARH